MSKSRNKNLDELNNSFLNENKIIFKKYKPIKEIGTGAFGKIYSTIRIEDKSVFAMKVEKRTPCSKILETEAYFLYTFKGLGIPQIITYGKNLKYNILIETLLGQSLFDIFLKTKKTCNIFNICLIAIQVIERLEFIHSKDYIYRDVKPENLMIGIEDPNVIYIIDYGLCKKYRSSKTGKHIQPKNIKKFIGTLKYASSNVVKGKEASRRDDLISLGFVLIYLYKRNLPWCSKFKGLDEETYYKIIHQKETFDNGKLLKDLPVEMVDFLKYVNNLRFEQDPEYSYMIDCFKKIISRLNLNHDKINFSWIDSKNSKLEPKLNVHRREGSRFRLLKSLEKNSKNQNTIDNDTVKATREIEDLSKNVSEENVQKNDENKNNNLIEYQKKRNILNNKNSINIRNRKNQLKQQNNTFNNNNQNRKILKINPNKIVYLNNNNNISNNINLEDKLNKNMNHNITYHRKVNTFVNYIYNNKISKASKTLNMDYQVSRRNSNNNTTNNYINNINIYNKIDNNNNISNIINNTKNIIYPKNKTKYIFNLNNNLVGNKRSDTMNFYTNNNNNHNNHNNKLNSTDNNKKIFQYKLLNNKKNLVINNLNNLNNLNSNNIKKINFNPIHKRTNAKIYSNVNTVHLHNYTDIY